MEPIVLTPTFAMCYGFSFAILASALTTVLCWNGSFIAGAFRSRKEAPVRGITLPSFTQLTEYLFKDVHVEILERNYASVPRSWYWAVSLSMTALACYVVVVYPLQLPLWGLFLAVSIAAIFLIPCGIILAVTNAELGLNVVTEFVAGYLLPLVILALCGVGTD
jgi:hypothetical protein